MKRNNRLKGIVVMIGLFLQVGLQAAPPITLHVEKAGTLSSLIPSNKKYEITDLTLTGDLNGTDIRLTRDMAGKDYRDYNTDGKLVNLDLSGANIVKGGDYYYEAYNQRYYTLDNSISSRMFANCTKIETVIPPSSVTSIGDSAFSYCSGLTTVTIPNGVTSIGGFAFSGCSGLTTVTIPNGVTSIGRRTFLSCSGLTSITLPNGVTSIGSDAFNGCLGLTSITIPNSVTSIYSYAFYGCTGLTSITIPNSVALLTYMLLTIAPD
ncbi:leucine-rich repeat domain-containing protein [Bacteroides sp. OttesenSCG-928-J23]|nr:leucine-rich repeat domain-containing protein [Bacteroides sp. OttesenSCG-928-J23]MDL2305669.1 leucine-rich repeat domain-containing protein [Bacteroides sp. OttesenSCG-928-D19]